MLYWHQSKFWVVLAAAEIAAFLISALLAMAIELLIEALGVSNGRAGIRLDVIGALINIYMAYDAFRFARSRARRWPQPRGFPVVTAPGSEDGG